MENIYDIELWSLPSFKLSNIAINNRGSNRLELVNSCYSEIVGLMGEEDAPDPDYFLECYGRMAVNSFHVMDENQVGHG